MSLPPGAWTDIEQGVGPDVGRVREAVAGDRVVLGSQGVRDELGRVLRDTLGAGPLEVLLREPGVTDVLVNGPREVWVDRGAGLERVPLDLGEDRAVRALAARLAGLVGRRLDDASPWVDAVLPSGVRLHAVVGAISPGGTHVSLRVPRSESWTLDDLEARGAVDPWIARALRGVVARRVAHLVTGGTGSGKTTLLAAMLSLVPAQERIVLVEDACELAPRHPHVVRLQARHPNVEGAGGVDLTALVRQALRMRPDRLVVGEVRGGEVRELLTALNTGHEGGCGTVHANSATDVVSRLEALGALAAMPPSAVWAQARSGLRLVIHLTRSLGVRRVGQVAVLSPEGDGRPVVLPALTHDGDAGVRPGPGLPLLVEVVPEARP
ncbi:TadA family conjugal transfer-associated ATPase [Arsenicicoccus cauae]|uniref:TadA family conjugal transfer-associated ATPase n=1 Tax=Arsenicicoccus cauae TaxID=2663847 RepID=A0A6I3IRS2_9MICO|nr:TadA family conjugal transfer-associated ATPase [Arsenicicoccus cauae]MTB71379.1 TadA family conjugal transfer-associated ATPase [Arsenicicoccus cauae]